MHALNMHGPGLATSRCPSARPFLSQPSQSKRSRPRLSESLRASNSDALTSDWRAFRAKLVAEERKSALHHEEQVTDAGWGSGRVCTGNMQILTLQNPRLAAEGVWAHPTPSIEKGGILLATLRTADILDNDSLEQVVVFIASHGPEGSMGVILNRPTSLTFGRKANGLRFPVVNAPAELRDAFDDTRVYCGGPTAQNVVHVMHPHALHKAVQIVPGVYLGGEQAAASQVMEGTVGPKEFKFFSGALLWEPGQLEREIQAGCWYSAACSRSLVLKHCIQLPTPLWREIMLLMGGTYAEVASEAYEGDGPLGE